MTGRRLFLRSTALAGAVAVGLLTLVVGASPASADPPGTVQATVAETSGSFLVGFCVAPSHPVLGSPLCSDSSPVLGISSVSAGGWTPVSLAPGSYNTALAASGSVALSPDGPVTVVTG